MGSGEFMSMAAAQADRFITEVVKNGVVWAIRDADGFPTSTNASGETAMPFWSLKSRAQKVIDELHAYRDFSPLRLSLADFIEHWLPGLEQDGLMVGLNWSGKHATGYDLSPPAVLARIEGASI
jgi:uncharacterized protein DUF2750